MSAIHRTIEIDADTAAIIDRRSAEEGISASEFVATLVSFENEPVTVSAEEIAELDRRWAAIQQGEPLIDHADVRRWLKTWGTADFKPWPETR